MEQKPKFKVGQVFESNDGGHKTTWTIKTIRQEIEYPSGKHFRFNYIIEQVITFKDGSKTEPFVFSKTAKGVLELLKPEDKHWYSISCE